MSDVKIVRLGTNEELVADVTTDGESSYFLKNILIIVPTEKGTIQLAPWMPYIDRNQEIEITEDKVLFTATPDKQIVKQHQEIFSKIVIPSVQ